jgi:GNAT superfamily N-acetyltransferase
MHEANTEFSETETVFAMLSDVPEPQRSILGASAVRIGGGVVTAMANDPTDYWSKALGFGFESPVDDALVGRIVDRYRAVGVRSATIQIAPRKLPDDWHEIAARHGLRAGGSWVRLEGPVDVVESPTRGLRVGPVPQAELAEWARVTIVGFGMPPENLAPMMAGAMRADNAHAFAAWDGDELVAGACLLVFGRVAHLAGAATLPSHRGRGAQSALIAVRARAAKEAGAERLFAETGNPEVPGANSSLTNMERAGMAVLYERVNWKWTSTSMPSTRG